MNILQTLLIASLLPWQAGSSTSGGGASNAGQDCGCDSELCPIREYGPSKITWFESQCESFLDAGTQECIESAALIDSGHSGGHADHAHSIPYNILTIFCSFAIGAALRFLLLGTQVPYTVVLFLIGMAFGGATHFDGFNLQNYSAIAGIDPHLIFFIFLPALIFESAFAMDIPTFQKVVGQCIILAVPGLMVASAMTGTVAKMAFTEYDWNWYACLLFGTILSATDPVAVVALLKELGASPVISTMIEGESLFNDGTAIVFFNVLVDAIKKSACTPVQDTCVLDFSQASRLPIDGQRAYSWPSDGGTPYCLCTEVECELEKSPVEILLEFCRVSFGGAGLGTLFGAITIFSLNRVFNDALIEVTLTLVAAYVTFFVCEGMFKVSGVLGVVACGCLMSHHSTCISPDVEHTLHHFWEMTTYLANTLIFLLAGLIVSLKAFGEVDATDFGYLLIIYVTINIARTLTLIMFMPVLRCFRYRLDLGNSALVAWGGLRGAVGLALALIIQADDQVAVQTVRTKVIFHVSGIVLLTLCVNGVSTSRIVRYFHLDEIALRRRRQMRVRWNKLQKEKDLDLSDLVAEPLYYDTNWEELDRAVDLSSGIPEGREDPYNESGWAAREGLEDDDETADRKQREEGRMAYITTCNASVHNQYAQGQVTPVGCRALHHFIVDARERGDRAQAEWEKEYSERQAELGSSPTHVHSTSNDMEMQALSMYGTAPPQEHSLVLLSADVIPPLFEPGRLMRMFEKNDRLKIDRWMQGFDVALGFIRCHELIQVRIHDLCEPHIANKISTHSKRVIKETCEVLERVAVVRPDISCSIKTKQASRAVLNSMRDHVRRMRHEGRLDDQDRDLLHGLVNAKIKSLGGMPGTMSNPTAEQILEDTTWYQRAERPCQRLLLAVATEEGAVRTYEPKTQLASGSMKSMKLPGLMLLMTGVVEVRVGRRCFRYGAGQTLGWQQLLTGSTRFSNVTTQSTCSFVLLSGSQVRALTKRYPDFRKAAWQDCGITSARLLLGMEVGGGQARFDEKQWTQRRVRKLAERGMVEVLQDEEGYSESHQRKHKFRPNSLTVLLRGRAWEFGEEDDHIDMPSMCKFPMLMPAAYKFATFTGHAILFTMEEDLTAAERARRRWGRLRSKIRSIFLWSGLRGARYKQCALAWALSRTPPPPAEPRVALLYREEAEQAALEEFEQRAVVEAEDRQIRSIERAQLQGHGTVEVVNFNGKDDVDDMPPASPAIRKQSVVNELESQQRRRVVRPQPSHGTPSLGPGKSEAGTDLPRGGDSAFRKPAYPAVPQLSVALPDPAPASPGRSRRADQSSPTSRRPSSTAQLAAGSRVVRMRIVAAEDEFNSGAFTADIAKHLKVDAAAVAVLGTEAVEGPLPPETVVRFQFKGLGDSGERLAESSADYGGKLPAEFADAWQVTDARLEGAKSAPSPAPSPPKRRAAVGLTVPPPDLQSILADLDRVEKGLPVQRYASSPPRNNASPSAKRPQQDFGALLKSPTAMIPVDDPFDGLEDLLDHAGRRSLDDGSGQQRSPRAAAVRARHSSGVNPLDISL
eukprot:TRINITY_DN1281_c0_g2_i2.p1 TRINITY_DN1281_c0_g2~~TRINITY_DN1281_c0_g2_i2.p1  ORF type:complete len:1553 (+),score=505.99 TRINITY_DN1281_c0_g2_i2:43-4701(+)